MLTIARSLRPMAAFVAVAEHGSFTAAAEVLGLTRAGVSKQVAALEEQLGVQLLSRTTRSVGLTEAGRAVLDHGHRMLAEVRLAHEAIRPLAETVSGSVRVTAPIGIGQRFVADALAGFIARHPRLDAELVLDDRNGDLVGGGFDLAVRAGRLRDSSLRCVKLGALQLVLCAAPVYLARAGEPTAPSDLGSLDWLEYTPLGSPQQVTLTARGKRSRLKLSGRLRTNDGEVLRRWLISGAGVSLLPRFWIERDLVERRLVRLLKKHEVAAGAIYAVHAHTRGVPRKVRELIEHLRATFEAAG